MSNLLEKASIITTPTAYENGKLLSVKPSVPFGSELVNETTDNISGWTEARDESTLSIVDNNIRATRTDVGADTIGVSSTAFTTVVGKTYGIKVNATKNNTNGNIYVRVSNNPLVQGQFFNQQNATDTISVDASFVATHHTAYVGILATSQDTGNYVQSNLMSIKEEIGADFDFSRGSSATRVNSQGLIEDVQIIGSELVQNGDFSQEGAELVTNGGFDTDSDWIKGGNVNISNGKANFVNSAVNDSLQQIGGLANNTHYKVTFTVSNYTSGTLRMIRPFYADAITQNGTYTFYGLSTFNSFFLQSQSNNSNYSINNVSVKEVGQNWSLDTGWSIEDGVAKLVGDGTFQPLETPFNITNGSKYRIKFDLISASTLLKLGFSKNNRGTYMSEIVTFGGSDVGEFTAELVADDNYDTFWISRNSGTVNAEIDNISVKEITNDTDLPRIDYTDGVGNILLEPQSTNLVTYSEDFSQWNRVNNVALSTDSTVQNPDGTDSTKLTKNSSGTAIVSDDGISISASTTYVFSFFVKKGNFDVVRAEVGSGSNNVNVYYTFSTDSFSTNESGTQTVISVDSLSFANDWKRICIVFTGSITSVNATLFIGTSINDYVYYFGAQLEEQSFETSYIPTVGTTVTRLLETLNNSGNADLISSTEGVLYAEIAALANDSTFREISLNDGTINNAIEIRYTNTSNKLQFVVRDSGTAQVYETYSSANVLDFHKAAISYKANEFKIFINGSQLTVDTSGTVPSGLNELSFNWGGANPFYGKTKCVAVFKEALSNDELECLTGEGYESFSALAQAFNYTII